MLVFALPNVASAQTERDDRSYIQAFLEDNLSDAGREVRITGFQGALSARATIEELSIADATGVWLTLRGVVLDWNRSALLRGRLEIGELSAKELLLPRKPAPPPAPQETPGLDLPKLPAPEAKPFSLPELPVSISIAAVSIGKVALGAPLFGAAADVSLQGSAELNEGAGKAALNISRIDGAKGSLRLAGTYSNASRNLDLSLVLSEAADGIAANLIGLPGRPSVDLSIVGAGPISAFTAKIGLDTDGVQRLGGEVTLQSTSDPTLSPDQHFAANISGDVRPLVLPQYRPFFGPDIRLGLRGTRPGEGGLTLDEISLTSDALTLAGQVDLGADNWPLRIDVTGRIASADGAAVLLSLPGPETRVKTATFTARYDAETGDDWSGAITIQDLQSADLSLADASLTGGGRLTQGNGTALGQVTGVLDMILAGIELRDEGLAQAVGPSLRGAVSFDMPEREPLTLRNIAVTGADYALSGAVVVQGLLDDRTLSVSGKVDLSARDLSRFSGISGQSLAGAATLRIAGKGDVLGGGFDLDITGTAQDLGLGIVRLDPLISGNSTLVVAAERTEAGTTIERLTITTPHTGITASATLTSKASTGRFEARLADAGRVRARPVRTSQPVWRVPPDRARVERRDQTHRPRQRGGHPERDRASQRRAGSGRRGPGQPYGRRRFALFRARETPNRRRSGPFGQRHRRSGAEQFFRNLERYGA